MKFLRGNSGGSGGFRGLKSRVFPRRKPPTSPPAPPRSEPAERLLAYPAGGELHVVAGGEHFHAPLTPRQMLGLADRFTKAALERMPHDDLEDRAAAARVTTADLTPYQRRLRWRRRQQQRLFKKKKGGD